MKNRLRKLVSGLFSIHCETVEVMSFKVILFHFVDVLGADLIWCRWRGSVMNIAVERHTFSTRVRILRDSSVIGNCKKKEKITIIHAGNSN